MPTAAPLGWDDFKGPWCFPAGGAPRHFRLWCFWCWMKRRSPYAFLTRSDRSATIAGWVLAKYAGANRGKAHLCWQSPRVLITAIIALGG
jgi:hypothetical protein